MKKTINKESTFKIDTSWTKEEKEQIKQVVKILINTILASKEHIIKTKQ